MSRVEALVTTMHQTDLSKYYEMNLSTDAVIANQADCDSESEEIVNGCTVKLITTDTRGLSRNRNTAIANIGTDTDYIIFADDDLRFYDNYEQTVISAFEKLPQADAIKFNLKCVSERKISMSPIKNIHRATRREVTSWGVGGLAVKASVLKKSRLLFNERFGTGTENYCGEDSIFLQDLFKHKIKVYTSPETIAEIDQSDSSWFEGHNEKYFTVGGMVFAEMYPLLCYPLIIRSAYKFSKRDDCKLSFLKILKSYYKGIKKNELEHKISKDISNK